MSIDQARACIGSWVIHRPPEGKPRRGQILSVGSWRVNLYFGGGALAKPVDPAHLVLAEAVAR